MASLREVRHAMRDELDTLDQEQPDWLASQRLFDIHILPDDRKEWIYIGYQCEQRSARTRRG